MKRIFITLLVLFSVSTFAQNHFVGAQFGMNLSNVYGAEWLKNTEFMASFSAGLTYDYQMKNNILLGSGLQYERKGFQDGITFTNDEGHVFSEFNSKAKYAYLSLPIKAGYQIGQKWTGYFFLGVVPAYLFQAHLTGPDISNTLKEKEYDITDEVNAFELSGLLEVGSKYNLNSKWALFVNASYLMGFTPVYKESVSPHPKNHRFNISLGVKYALKGE